MNETNISKPAVPLQNELAILEFIHCLVETLDRCFQLCIAPGDPKTTCALLVVRELPFDAPSLHHRRCCRFFQNVCELDLMFNLEMVRLGAKGLQCFVKRATSCLLIILVVRVWNGLVESTSFL